MEYDDVSELMIKREQQYSYCWEFSSLIDKFLRSILYQVLNIMISLRLTVIQM
ncbi:hypothetical protein BANRA_04626 [Escherichia coli]|nr:hypothetical protein BANRA_04626 [Escherichia coli]